jgi:hypothetical protein
MPDPRSANCQGYAENAGLVTGVLLHVLERPTAPYALKRVELIPEAAAAGNCVARCTVVDAAGLPISEHIYLAWPYDGETANYTMKSLPGNPSGEHFISNGYTPPAPGPLMIFLGDAEGQIISDVCAGLGLPKNHHVCYALVFQQRSADSPPQQPTPDLNPTNALLAEIANYLARLCRHLGA